MSDLTKLPTGQELKQEVFNQLLRLKVDTVSVEFDGGGDSGQIDSISAGCGTDMEVPWGKATKNETIWTQNSHEIKEVPVTISDLVEALCIERLGDMGYDWYNNDGGYGTFTITVATGHVLLDYEQRISSSESHQFEYPWDETDENAVPQFNPPPAEPPRVPKDRKVRAVAEPNLEEAISTTRRRVGL